MALRKMKKALKPVIWVVTIAFVVSLFFIGAGSYTANNKNKYALKVNGKKIEAIKIERITEQNLSNYQQYYGTNLDVEFIRTGAVKGLIEQEFMLSEAKKLHLGVTGKDVDAKYKEAIGETPESTVKQILSERAMTIKDFKEDIKNGLVAEKAAAKLKEAAVTEDALKAYFEENKSKYVGKTFEGEKKQIEEIVKGNEGSAKYNKWLEDKYKTSKIEVINSVYSKYIKTPAIKFGTYTMDNLELGTGIFYRKMFGEKDEKKVYTDVIDFMKQEMALVEEAKKRGIKVDNAKYSEKDAIEEYKKALKKDIKTKMAVTDADIEGYFTKNKTKYDSKENITYKVLYLALEPSEEDKKNTKAVQEEKVKASHILFLVKKKEDDAAVKAKAENMLKEALAGKDFAELAKTNSEDTGSAKNGGDLGYFAKGAMVPEFEKAAFSGEKGKVYPALVKTSYGYHIIKVIDKKVEEKAGTPVAGEKTKAGLKLKADTALKEAADGKTDFDAVVKKYSKGETKSEYGPVNKGDTLPVIGAKEKIEAEIFAMQENTIKLFESEDGYYIVKMTKHVPFKAAILAEIKDGVTDEYKEGKAGEEITKLKNDLKTSVKVEFIDKTIAAKIK